MSEVGSKLKGLLLTIRNHMFKHLVLLCLLSLPLPIFPVITYFSIKKSPTGQYIHLYALDHKLEGSPEEFKALNATLKEIDDQAEKSGIDEIPLYIFVEQAACFLPQMVLHGRFLASVAHALLPMAEKGEFKKIRVESCEVRQASGIAYDLMKVTFEETVKSLILVPQIYKDYQKKWYGYSYDEVTFQHVCDEFTLLLEKNKKLAAEWMKENEKVGKIFKQVLSLAQETYAELLKKIQEIGLKKLVHEHSLSLFNNYSRETQEPIRNKLVDLLTSSFSHFVDLYVYDKILRLQKQNIKNFAVFVGGHHQERVYKMLAYTGYDHAYPPIPPENLSYFKDHPGQLYGNVF